MGIEKGTDKLSVPVDLDETMMVNLALAGAAVMSPEEPFDTTVTARRSFGAVNRNPLNIGNGQDNYSVIIRWIERPLIEMAIALV
ncbi:MAG: hypothetical protein ACM3ZQ_01495 [Bacillota bacterium]